MDFADLPLVLMMNNSDVALTACREDREIAAVTSQYEMTPGAKGFILMSEGVVESDVTVFEVLDWLEYLDDFFESAERVAKDYVLCRWWSNTDRVGSVGWFHRSRMVPCPSEVVDKLLEAFATEGFIWRDEDWPEMDRYFRRICNERYVDQNDAAADDGIVFTPTTCPQCSSDYMTALVEVNYQASRAVAEVLRPEDGKNLYELIGCDWKKHTEVWTLKCLDCGWSRPMEKDEFRGGEPLNGTGVGHLH